MPWTPGNANDARRGWDKKLAWVVAVLFLGIGCRSTGPPPGGVASGGGKGALPVFADVTQEKGVSFRHSHGGGSRLRNILESFAGGVSFCDLNKDGRLDLYLTTGTPLDSQGNLVGGPDHPKSALYFQNPDGTYTDVTDAAGLGENAFGMGGYCADYDNDGDLDLFVTRYGRDALFRNEGNGTFIDVAQEAGVADTRWSSGAAFGDIDNDGDLDLYVCHYLKFRPNMVGVHTSALSKREGFRFFPGPRDYEGPVDSLFRNEGNGRFTDITSEAGLIPGGKAIGVIFSDLDRDGDQDIYVANDKTNNQLYWNRGDGTYTEGAFLAGVAVGEDGEETGAMGLAVTDLDNDGFQDIFITNMVFEYNTLYLNQKDRTFSDITPRMGLGHGSYRFVGFGTTFFDYDNDGLKDVAIVNGHIVDYIEAFSTGMTFRMEPFLFRNEGATGFRDVTKSAGPWFKRRYVGRGLASGDIDNDGDLDLLIGTNHGPAYLLRNEGGNALGWLRIKVQGTHCNRDGFGASVVVKNGQSVRTEEVRAQSSFMASSDPRVHFGLGELTEVEAVEVHWPCGRVETIERVPARRTLLAVEGSGIEILPPEDQLADRR